MTTSLTVGATTVALPDDLDWNDEFAWVAVQQAQEYTLTGSLVLESAAKQAGRPITLRGDLQRAWVTRAALLTLRAWADAAGTVMTLALRGDEYTVAWDHERGAITAAPICDYSDPAAGDWYAVELRLIEL